MKTREKKERAAFGGIPRVDLLPQENKDGRPCASAVGWWSQSSRHSHSPQSLLFAVRSATITTGFSDVARSGRFAPPEQEESAGGDTLDEQEN